MFIQNNKDSIRQRLTARNIAPLMERIYEMRQSLKACEFCVRFDDIVSVDFAKDSLKIPHPKSLPQVEGLAIDSPSLAESFAFDSPSLARGGSAIDFPSLAEGDKGGGYESNKNSYKSPIDSQISQNLYDLLLSLKPWRKGYFRFFSTTIESEWNSAIKFNLIAPHLNITDKIIADIGCNNGYYAFRMLPLKPRKIVGFEPSAFYKAQFELINSFVRSDKIAFELLGIEDLAHYDTKFDCIICLGVIYHRTNPIDCLKILKNALNAGGSVILDTLIIESPCDSKGESMRDFVLSPLIYAKMKNVYFIPTISAFENWLKRAGFRDIELIAVKKTTADEQRKTAWIDGESLSDFLDKDDESKTIEGYPAPTRAYFKAKI